MDLQHKWMHRGAGLEGSGRLVMAHPPVAWLFYSDAFSGMLRKSEAFGSREFKIGLATGEVIRWQARQGA
jgi:hypothetical protein